MSSTGSRACVSFHQIISGEPVHQPEYEGDLSNRLRISNIRLQNKVDYRKLVIVASLHCECSQKLLQSPLLSQSEIVAAFIKRNAARVG